MISEQDSHGKSIAKMVNSYPSLDPKQLAKNLKSAFDYKQLTITELNGSSLYNYDGKVNEESVGYNIMKLAGLLPPQTKAISQTHKIKIHFKLNHQPLFVLFDAFFYSSLLIVFVILTLLSISIRQLIVKVVKRSISNISNVISDFTDNDDSVAWTDLPDEFMPLAETLETLHISYENKLREWRKSAEAYKTEATRDELTGLKNRICFVEHFENQLRENENLDFGILSVTRASELNIINQNRGYQAGDEYITELSQLIQRIANNYENSEVFRLNGSDFAVVLPNVVPKEAENYSLNLQGRLGELQKNMDLEAVAYSGVVSYQAGRPLGELLALADTGISIAQTKHPNAWHMQTDTSVLENISSKYGNQNWREVIDDVVSNARVILYYQPIQPTNKTSKVYAEVLSRFTNAEDQVLPTASFVAMAEKMDKIIGVDKMILEQTMRLILERGLQNQYFGVNITAKSAHDEQFAIWLERRLLRDPAITSKLILEVSEFGMQQNMAASKRFIDMVHRTGARVTVERFGLGMTSFKFFRDLKPDFIKMDGSYSRNIDEDKNNQYFMRVIVDLAHRLGVNVLAESVETQEEKHTLEQLFVDGTQGYFIGKPVEF
jgi:diguanylate cyclase (GGDEF)-like protein